MGELGGVTRTDDDNPDGVADTVGGLFIILLLLVLLPIAKLLLLLIDWSSWDDRSITLLWLFVVRVLLLSRLPRRPLKNAAGVGVPGRLRITDDTDEDVLLDFGDDKKLEIRLGLSVCSFDGENATPVFLSRLLLFVLPRLWGVVGG